MPLARLTAFLEWTAHNTTSGVPLPFLLDVLPHRTPGSARRLPPAAVTAPADPGDEDDDNICRGENLHTHRPETSQP